jgi:hypothetical protein
MPSSLTGIGSGAVLMESGGRLLGIEETLFRETLRWFGEGDLERVDSRPTLAYPKGMDRANNDRNRDEYNNFFMTCI